MHDLAKETVLELETPGKWDEVVILVIDDRGETLQGSDMTLLRDGTGQREDNTLTQRLNTGFGGVAAMHHIVDDNRELSFGQFSFHVNT